MALTAVLEFGNNDVERYTKRYMIADYSFLFDRSYSELAPTGASRCRQIEVTVIAPGKEDLSLVEWFDTQDSLSGRIMVSLVTGSSLETADSQVVYFDDAKCVRMSELYDIEISRRRLLKLVIGAERIKIDGVTFRQI